MSTKSTPAFPVPLNPGQCWNEMGPCDGMTLRDYFAAKAMQAHITASFQALTAQYANDPDAINPTIAKAAYETADAMIAARTQ